MIFSLLHLVLAVRALARSVTERFVFGVVGGLVRIGLMVVGAMLALKQSAFIMLPGVNLHASPSEGSSASASAAALLLVSIAGPVLSASVLWASYRRFHDVPFAEEEKLQRPFNAWLPVGILDAIYVVIAISAAVLMEGG